MNSCQFHHRRTNSRSRRSFWIRWFAMASRIAGSLPGQGASQWSACVAVFDRRTSKTTSFAPFFLPSITRWAWGLK